MTNNNILNFFFNDTATTEIYTVMNTLSLHDALPIYDTMQCLRCQVATFCVGQAASRSEEHTSELQSLITNSYAVFCLKKKKKIKTPKHKYLSSKTKKKKKKKKKK